MPATVPWNLAHNDTWWKTRSLGKSKLNSTPQKTNMTMETHHLKMYFLLKMRIFQCHVSFQGCIFFKWLSHRNPKKVATWYDEILAPYYKERWNSHQWLMAKMTLKDLKLTWWHLPRWYQGWFHMWNATNKHQKTPQKPKHLGVWDESYESSCRIPSRRMKLGYPQEIDFLDHLSRLVNRAMSNLWSQKKVANGFFRPNGSSKD